METAAIGTLAFISLLVLARRFVVAKRSALALREEAARTGEKTLSCPGFCDVCEPTNFAVSCSNKRRVNTNEKV
jgi:hypothetical protein